MCTLSEHRKADWRGSGVAGTPSASPARTCLRWLPHPTVTLVFQLLLSQWHLVERVCRRCSVPGCAHSRCSFGYLVPGPRGNLPHLLLSENTFPVLCVSPRLGGAQVPGPPPHPAWEAGARGTSHKARDFSLPGHCASKRLFLASARGVALPWGRAQWGASAGCSAGGLCPGVPRPGGSAQGLCLGALPGGSAQGARVTQPLSCPSGS